jgi:hypothetical protein
MWLDLEAERGELEGQAHRRYGAQRTGVHQKVKTTFYVVISPVAGPEAERGELKARLTGAMARNKQESIKR